MFKCKYCGKADIARAGGLTQHINQSKRCFDAELRELGAKKTGAKQAPNLESKNSKLHAKRTRKSKDVESNKRHQLQESDVEEPNFPPMDIDDEEEASFSGPDTSILEDFQRYSKQALLDWGPEGGFSPAEREAITLLHVIRSGKASMRTYDVLMDWHFRTRGRLPKYGKVSNHPDFKSRSKIYKLLLERYNLAEKGKNTRTKLNIDATITLPHSHAKAKIIKNNVKTCLQSLLTDPRLSDDDYLFFDNNPLAKLPNLSNDPAKVYIGDINTGEAYRKSYAKYIKRPGKQVLLPIILYIDGTATGQFAHLPVTPLKFTLGIFNRKARDKPYLWRTLGYVPVTSASASRGNRLLAESGHADAANSTPGLDEDEGKKVTNKDIGKAQDLHSMLDKIMEELVEIVETGFVWDLVYRNKPYKGIEFVPFIMFIKADTEEADRLCGSFTSRTKNVKQLCRYCCCPTNQTDNPRAEFARKTINMVRSLVEKEDVEGLKELSQQLIDNCFYNLRFGGHNEEGIHGACPLEMLHALLLGIFKYIRDCFFTKIGPSSELAKEINALAIKFGELFCRQSDRHMPKTKFSNGIQGGKLMAKEYRGVLLIIAAILRSGSGSELLKKKGKGPFSLQEVEDWLMLVETLLMWEMWLKSDRMKKSHVLAAMKKHRYIMYLIRKVGNRTEGMGLRIMKFHAISHMAQDIINFGVPMNYDTGSDESGHKPSKVAAKLTQRKKDTFDEQVALRLTEVQLLELAMEEINNQNPIWAYGYEKNTSGVDPMPRQERKSCLSGDEMVVGTSQNGSKCMVLRNKSNKTLNYHRSFVKFVSKLLNKVEEWTKQTPIRTTYKDAKGQIFRSTPSYRGMPWHDWVAVSWEEQGKLPSKIWGFIDLTSLPRDNTIFAGGIGPLEPQIYAIIESAEVDKKANRDFKSELFTPIETEVCSIRNKKVDEFKYYLADVRAFEEPLVVIPDFGRKPNSYLMMESRSKWSKLFENWLEMSVEAFPDFSDDEEQDSDKENYQEGSDLEEEDNEEEDSDLEAE